MPYLDRPGAKLFYDVTGTGPETIITTHGINECGAYWSRTGISAGLASDGYRVVDMDLRAHGRSVTIAGEDPGFDVDSVAADIGALATHLGAERFHLLTHATGGIAGLRFAMDHSDRLLSLISTDTGSATIPSDKYSDPDYVGDYPERLAPPIDIPAVREIESMNAHLRIREKMKGDGRPFQSGFIDNEDPARCWHWMEDVVGMGNPTRIAEFGRHFFTDFDPMIDGLKRISCPNLVLLGERDEMFVKPAELLARHIPDVEHRVVAGRGHMLAIEDPAGALAIIREFLGRVKVRET